MKRGGKDFWAQRGGEAYRGHVKSDSNDDKWEPVNRESENFSDEMDDSQDPWNPGSEYDEWDINTADDDDTLT